MKVALATLENMSLSALRVRSVGLGLYTAEASLNDGWAVICDEQGKVLQFTGMEWLRRRLGHLRVEQATLLHASAYHEMIGLEAERIEPLEVPIAWPGDRAYN